MKTFRPADILIPQNIDMTKWSVVACDQYTSEPEYWKKAEEIVGDAPSALRVVFPEIYLDEGEERIERINAKMEEYLKKGIFAKYPDSMIYVERRMANGSVRRGIVGAVDLEDYEYTPGAGSPVRATEGTVLERIPPRVKIRENAPIELPHVMLLIDDRNKEVIEKIDKSALEKVYDFDLMMDGGHLAGYLLNQAEQTRISDALDRLASKDDFEKRYDARGKNPLVFAVGDGNHSLATAKTCWENLKKELPEEEWHSHPARFALVELVNLYDSSLEFEAIHRVVFGVDPQHVVDCFLRYYEGASLTDNGGQLIRYIYRDGAGYLYVKDAPSQLAVGTLQKFLDEYIEKVEGRIDYIHGEDVTEKLSGEEGNIGFLLPAMEKDELFRTVIHDGVLPRKTFSMGEAKEKRFYLEAKEIRKQTL